MDDLLFSLPFLQKDHKLINELKIYRGQKHLTEDALTRLVNALAEVLLKRDENTFRHSKNVARMCLEISKTMGLSKKSQKDIFICAYLHDIGKICIKDVILKKEGILSNAEYSYVKKHPALGEEILMSFPALEATGRVIRHHHEKYDGSGYPDKLRGEQIPLQARIIAVADTFDAMTTRAFPRQRNKTEAISEIKRNAGSQFDVEIASSFIDFL